ncbi:adenylate/guanylate cyclase domain-containing protein [Nocardioides sp. Kera G14]|uniref:adenylate/guanylate cyclase domain-containing protein n=1 Tax=Nocardioides sp. Kera G14 TaxID=2884264 RepID=UPI001D103ADC|nr:adenylate/guanylate cyclase domain-containing protein [Nocardioides sp. Kera G14]UDY23356.1 adenylate/guanylate cyclase domain-containing protein [Nocardioides sp. Kera G14]
MLLGESPSMTRQQVADAAGVPLPLADELWRLLGFPKPDPDERAFTSSDVESLRHTKALYEAGVLSPDEQSAMVRTWGRSFARLAEWEVALLADIAVERPGDLATEAASLASEVIPRVEWLQSHIWRRHLAAAASRVLAVSTGEARRMAVCFVDIVGYTARSRSMSEEELVEWLEEFESTATGVVVDHGCRLIKTLGDAVLFVGDDPVAAAEAALTLTDKGESDSDPFPRVRGGLSVGEVVPRLGDVFGPTVNIASRLTSIARPGTVVVDDGAVEALSGGYSLQRLRRTSVKGYSRLQPWALRRVVG